MRRSYLVALIVVIAAVSVWYFTWHRVLAPPPSPATTPPLGFQLPPASTFIERRLSQYPVPRSQWRTDQEAMWTGLTEQARADFVVVPFENAWVQEGFDMTTRSLMAATLAQEIATMTGYTVLDPYIAARALGDPGRRYDDASVDALAQRVGAKWVIRGFAFGGGKMSVTVSIDRVPLATTQRIGTSLEYLPYSAATAPLDVFRSEMSGILRSLGVKRGDTLPVRNTVGDTHSQLDPFAIAQQPFAGTATDAALRFQILGALTPESSERTRRRMFERSLLAAERLPHDSDVYRVLKGRALLNLGQRPEALAVFDRGATTSEEQEIVAALNGNLTDVDRLAPACVGAQRLFALLDANALRASYGVADRERSNRDAASIAVGDEVIAQLIQLQFLGWDIWQQSSTLPILLALERDFPVKGANVEANVRSAATLGQMVVPPELFAAEHWREIVKQTPQLLCCSNPIGTPSRADYLDVLMAQAEATLLRSLDRMIRGQGLPQRALDYLDVLAPVYAGHGGFEAAKSRAQIALANQSQGATREAMARSATANAYHAYFWEQGQSNVAAEAIYLAMSSSDRGQYGMDFNLFQDLPARVGMAAPGTVDFSADDRRVQSLAYATSQFDAARQLIEDLDTAGRSTEAVTRDIEGRFRGDPEKDMFLGERDHRAGRDDAARDHYASAVASQPSYWPARAYLGAMLMQRDDYPGAARLFEEFPAGFAAGSPLEVTNRASQAGNLFYFRGRLDLARPYLEISASTRTGAESEMMSAIRLELMDGAFVDAAGDSLQRATRYDSTYAFRDYVALLHLLGKSNEAWDGFEGLLRQYPQSPHVWETATVGQRLAHMSDADVIAWAARDEHREPYSEAYRLAVVHLVRSATMDRVPSAEMLEAIKSMDGPVLNRPRDGLNVRTSFDNPGFGFVVGPSGHVRDRVGVTPEVAGPTTGIPSELALFVEGYRFIKSGDVARAASSWSTAADAFDLTQEPHAFLLPYYAFAMAASGQLETAKRVLQSYGSRAPAFERKLADGVLLAFSGSHEAANAALTAGLANREFTEARPVHVEYEFAEILTWLAERTGVPRYRERALDWAKANQRIHPWFAWPYALEAKLTESPRDRDRAARFAAYLDTKSSWLSETPNAKAVIAQGHARGNPFVEVERTKLARTAL